MTICPITSLWSNGIIVTLLSCDISLGCGFNPSCALIFAYNNNSSYTDAILSSVQHHSVLFSITQFCSAFSDSELISSLSAELADQFWSALSNAEWGHCWVHFWPKWLGKEEFEFWSVLIRKILWPLSADQHWSKHVGHRQDLQLFKTSHFPSSFCMLFKNKNIYFWPLLSLKFSPNATQEWAISKPKIGLCSKQIFTYPLPITSCCTKRLVTTDYNTQLPSLAWLFVFVALFKALSVDGLDMFGVMRIMRIKGDCCTGIPSLWGTMIIVLVSYLSRSGWVGYWAAA